MEARIAAVFNTHMGEHSDNFMKDQKVLFRYTENSD